jgi:phosphatidylinositol-3-phosphatase
MATRAALAGVCAVLAAGVEDAATGAADAAPVNRLRAPHACGRTPHRRPDIRHVIVIVLENHPFPKIIGHAGFITSLAHRCGLAANYHHNARVSLPNYLAMTSGSTHGLHRNCMPKQCPIRGPSIFA